MPKKGSKKPYRPKVVYEYTLQDIAELAGIKRNALNVEKVRGKIDPADFKSVVSFLIRRVIDKHLSGDLFGRHGQSRKKVKKGKGDRQVSRRRTRKTAGRK